MLVPPPLLGHLKSYWRPLVIYLTKLKHYIIQQVFLSSYWHYDRLKQTHYLRYIARVVLRASVCIHGNSKCMPCSSQVLKISIHLKVHAVHRNFHAPNFPYCSYRPCSGQVFACMEISIHPKVYAVFACLEISIHPKVYAVFACLEISIHPKLYAVVFACLEISIHPKV